MTRTVKVPVPKLATKSRNVKRYVLAVLRRQTLAKALHDAKAAESLAQAALTGGQKAQAERLLLEVGGLTPGGPPCDVCGWPMSAQERRAGFRVHDLCERPDTPDTVAEKARTARAVGEVYNLLRE
jgi:hypothetical protein